MKRLLFRGPGPFRIVGLGLLLSLVGGLGLVTLASSQSAHAAPAPHDPPPGLCQPAGGGHPRGEPMPPAGPLSMPLPALLPGLVGGPLPPGLTLTDAQRERLRQIADALHADLERQHGAAPDAAPALAALLLAPRIDAQAAEGLRQQQLAAQDRLSRRLLQASIDAAEVLTPDQRAQLLQALPPVSPGREGPAPAPVPHLCDRPASAGAF